MIDFKYHIISLVAVFLALAIGILVGSTMVGGDILIEQQKLMVDRLEADFRSFREQNRILRDELTLLHNAAEAYQLYAQEILPTIVNGRLDEMKLAILNASDYDLPQNLLKTIDLAGGKVVFYTAISTPEHLELIIHSLLDDVKKLDGAILIGGNKDDSSKSISKMELPLIKALKKNNQGIIILGAERSDVLISNVKNYQEYNLDGTIDNIETVIGQTSLVLSLTGLLGNYGIKNSAQQLIPSFNF